jgi:Rrf2 family nitric oxide-sensitive transcriptional repressor
VVRAFESLEGFVDCMDVTSPGCVVSGVCGLRHALGAALTDFLGHLDDYTLADLVPESEPFLSQLKGRSSEAVVRTSDANLLKNSSECVIGAVTLRKRR